MLPRSWCSSRSALIFASVLVLIACSDASSPGTPKGDVIFAIGGENHEVVVVNPGTGTVIERPGPVPNNAYSPVLSSDSSTLYFSGSDSTVNAIYALSTASLSLRRVIDLAYIDTPIRPDSLLFIGDELAIAPGDPTLYDGSAISLELPQQAGLNRLIAAIDPAGGVVSWTIGPVPTYSVAGLPVGPAAGSGTLIAVGPPVIDGTFARIFIIGPGSSFPNQTMALPGSVPSDFAQPVTITPSGNGRLVYLSSASGAVFAYDLVSQAIVGSLHIGAFAKHMAISPDGSRLYAVGGGDPSADPSLRSIRVFDATLVEQPSISLEGQAALHDSVPPLEGLAVSRDGKSIYVAAGTSSTIGRAKDEIIVMTLATGAITHVVRLNQWGYLTLVVGR